MNGDTKHELPDYYGLFQIAPDAGQMDVINAYRHAKLAYQHDSLAVYSLFSEQDLEAIRAQVEEAYRVLSDPEKRRHYDALHKGHDTGGEGASSSTADNVVVLRKQRSDQAERALERTPEHPLHAGTHHPLMSSYSGSALRAAREAEGVSLEAIAERTKISKRYLQAIESEDAEHFPETVYLRGYLRQYCHEIGLDPDQVLQHYPPLTR